ncbi:MAG: hypothetical protein H6706_02500 [Myxococcales bacterium]|nr:hypothetical protein [Myxococcales bacterium]
MTREHPSGGRRFMVAAIGLLVLGAAVIFFVNRSGRVEPFLQEVGFQRPTWAEYEAEVKASPPPPPGAADALLAAFHAVNRAELTGGSAAAAAHATRVEAAWQYTQLRTPEAYVQLGRQQGLLLQTRLEALLAWCRAEGRAVKEALAIDPPPPVVAEWLDVGGGFLAQAEEAGLVADGRVVDVWRPFIQALFLQHWIAPLRQRLPVDGYLRGPERIWFLRWKVERQQKGSLESRLAAADELRALPDYPADINAGVLLFQAGRLDEAAERFRRANHPFGPAFGEAVERAR